MDTPGLLERPDDFRNKMELLTLAALQHLPSSVMFVADLTEECGTSVSEQWLIRQELKQRFPDKPWVDVLSKADLLEGVWQAAAAAGAAGVAGIQPQQPDQPQQSQQQPGQQQLDQQQQQRTGQEEEAVELELDVQDAVQFAAALPRAVRVSSVTEAGFRQLLEELVLLLKSPAALAQLAAAAAADAEAAAAEEQGGGPGEVLLLRGPA
jgi:nucleolar GTP-binding protein